MNGFRIIAAAEQIDREHGDRIGDVYPFKCVDILECLCFDYGNGVRDKKLFEVLTFHKRIKIDSLTADRDGIRSTSGIGRISDQNSPVLAEKDAVDVFHIRIVFRYVNVFQRSPGNLRRSKMLYG